MVERSQISSPLYTPFLGDEVYHVQLPNILSIEAKYVCNAPRTCYYMYACMGLVLEMYLNCLYVTLVALCIDSLNFYPNYLLRSI